jgi:hypothetical protein
MSAFSELSPTDAGSVTLLLSPPNKVSMSGTIAARNPAETVAPLLRKVHEAATQDGLSEVLVDVTGLSFVNSSAIRQFIDWTSWVKAEPTGKRYLLKFRTSRNVTWQKTTFAALKSLAGDAISVEVVD